MLVRLSGTLPVLDSVIVCGALAEPTFWLANIRAAGERVAPLRSAVPERLTEDGVAAKSPEILKVPAPD